MSSIELRSVAKQFGATAVLTDVDLTVPDGTITAVLGASGSGKTTLLRLIAGFEHVDAGSVSIGGRVVDDQRRTVRAQHRGVGYVPQDAALFPHLTVAGNIGFGVSRSDRSQVGHLIDLVGLTGMGGRYPHQLSGGQQQRVALARALAIRPAVVLLDEPFSALDASLRAGLRRDVARILTETGTTTVLVTHDQDEALSLADQIAVLQRGRVVACADPRTLYGDPADLTTAVSVGETNILDAVVEGGRARSALGRVPLAPGRPVTDGPATLLLRPEQLALHVGATPEGVTATVVDVQYYGHDALASLTVEGPGGCDLLARVSGELAVRPGQRVWVDVVGTGRAWAVAEPVAGAASG